MGFFLLFPEGASTSVQVPCKEFRVTLDGAGYLRNRRTKFDRTALEVYKGDTETFKFQVFAGQSPANLLGYSIVAQARKTPDDPSTLFDIVINDGEYGSDFIQGIIVLKLQPAVTGALPSLCRYDIQGIVGTTITTLVSGTIQLHRDVVQV